MTPTSDMDINDLVHKLLANASSEKARHCIIYDALMKGLKLPEEYTDKTIRFWEENDLLIAAKLAEKVGKDYNAIQYYSKLAEGDDTLQYALTAARLCEAKDSFIALERVLSNARTLYDKVWFGDESGSNFKSRAIRNLEEIRSLYVKSYNKWVKE